MKIAVSPISSILVEFVSMAEKINHILQFFYLVLMIRIHHLSSISFMIVKYSTSQRKRKNHQNQVLPRCLGDPKKTTVNSEKNQTFTSNDLIEFQENLFFFFVKFFNRFLFVKLCWWRWNWRLRIARACWLSFACWLGSRHHIWKEDEW